MALKLLGPLQGVIGIRLEICGFIFLPLGKITRNDNRIGGYRV